MRQRALVVVGISPAAHHCLFVEITPGSISPPEEVLEAIAATFQPLVERARATDGTVASLDALESDAHRLAQANAGRWGATEVIVLRDLFVPGAARTATRG
jgi:hypothetical protein